MKEKIELVTNFASLRAGMKCIVKCSGCEKMHWRFLLRLERSLLLENAAGEQRICDKWIGEGDRPLGCPYTNRADANKRGGRPGVSEWVVEDRRVYRVIDGLEQSTESRKSVTA